MSYLVSAIERSNSNCFLFQRLSGQKILSRIPAPRRTVITTYYRVVSPGFNFISCGGLFMLDVPDFLVFFPLNFVLTMKSWTQNRSLNMALILGLGKRPQPQSITLIVARFNFIFSDHDFIQEQENRLLLMCKRTMALPVGRCGKFLLVVFCLICDLRWVICEKSGDVMFSALEFGGIGVGSLCSHEICFLLKRDVYNGHLSTSTDRNYSNSTTGFDRTGPA